MSYGRFGERRQVAAVRSALAGLLATQGLSEWPLSLILNSFNMTFALELPDGRVALRVNSGSTRTLEEVRGEIAWTAAIHEEGEVLAPEPARIFGGSSLAFMRVKGIERDVAVVAYRWLAGRHVGKNRPSRHAFLLGQLMSRLHGMTRRWDLPASTSRPPLTSVLEGLPWRLPEDGPFREVHERANAVLETLDPAAQQLVHFDLHFGNVKVSNGRMCVFDFDDSVMAWPGVDAAQAMFYLRREGPGDRLEGAFWEGAGTSVEDLGLSRDEFELLIGGRALLVATDLAGTKSAALAAIASQYITVTRRRLEHLLQEGVFDPSIARMA